MFGALTAAVAASAMIKWSRVGLQARAVRDDPLAAETAGISIVMSRVWLWTASAFITGVGGALLAYQLTAFSPNSFYLNQTIPIVVMVVLGGANSVIGAVTGAVLLTGGRSSCATSRTAGSGRSRSRGQRRGGDEHRHRIGAALLLARPEGAMSSWEPQFLLRRRHRLSIEVITPDDREEQAPGPAPAPSTVARW